MIESSTVLVLGAGASRPYGFPVGRELYERVCGGNFTRLLLERDDSPLQKIMDQQVDDFRRQLQRSGHRSVDAFLERRPDLIEVGKRLIAAALIPFEQEHSLFQSDDGSCDHGRWYHHLFSAIDSSLDRFAENRLSILTFNYDRSLEHFLTTAIHTNYDIPMSKAWKTLQHIPIIHLHGILSPYAPNGGVGRRYENHVSLPIVNAAFDWIKIVSDDVTEDRLFNRAHAIIERAQKIIFLGFGYNPVNIARLKIDCASPVAKIQCSCTGMTPLEQEQAIRIMGRPIEMGDPRHNAMEFLRHNVEFG